ncbi:hypothetical protein [Terrarubrum flagellatum]|uniref:hypothetical protein n=1 Tax=Terrirubrum flagellatum TaxID=2895980 RepID=UPI0031451080
MFDFLSYMAPLSYIWLALGFLATAAIFKALGFSWGGAFGAAFMTTVVIGGLVGVFQRIGEWRRENARQEKITEARKRMRAAPNASERI